MADKTRIKVAVLEGDYADLGLPLLLSLQLQCMNLKLSGALWSAKSSASGFSVSLYWPTTDTTHGAPVKVKKARKNRKHRRKQAPASATNNQTTSLVQSSSNQHSKNSVYPNKEHPSPVHVSDSENSHHSGKPQCSIDSSSSITMSINSSSPTMSNNSPVVDLAECSNLQYVNKDGVHGVTNHLGEPGWTPVIGRKRTIPSYIKRRFPPDHPIHKQESDTESNSSDEQDLDNVIPAGGNVNVEFVMVDNTPGLSIMTRNTRSWTPVAARTRARLKK